MLKIILSVSLICVPLCAFSQGAAQPKITLPQLSYGQQEEDVTKQDEDIKKLILKYDEAPAAQKPAVRKEIEKLETQNEQKRITAREERIKRQEDKIKELKKNNEDRKKNIKQNVSGLVDCLISPQSVEKIKKESMTKKVIDKVKK